MKAKVQNLFVIIMLALLLPLEARGQFNFITNGDNTITITRYTGSGGEVVIPAATNGYPVASIGTNAFFNKTSVTSVTIPDSVTSIAALAFSQCYNMTNLIIGDNVTSIGTNAFSNCLRLTNAAIPDSVTSIGDSAFFGCTGLTNMIIPNNVTSIGNDEFFDDYSLENVSIGNSVTNIGRSAFANCVRLPSVTIPNSVISIGNGAFAACQSLTNFTVIAGNPAYSSADGVLFDRAQTTLLQYPAAKAGNYHVPNGVISIWTGAFFACNGLKNVSIPNSVTNIENNAFNSCLYLANVTIGSGVTNIGTQAFYYCTRMTNITFLGNAPALGGNTFVSDTGTVFYYYGTSGWSASYGGLPTVMLYPPPQLGGSGGNVGVQAGAFGFSIIGGTNQTIVVEVSTNLVNWQSVWTNTLSGASTNFIDSVWTNYPARFYRAR